MDALIGALQGLQGQKKPSSVGEVASSMEDTYEPGYTEDPAVTEAKRGPGSSIAQGAAAGAPGGPWGALIGGALGAIKGEQKRKEANRAARQAQINRLTGLIGSATSAQQQARANSMAQLVAAMK